MAEHAPNLRRQPAEWTANGRIRRWHEEELWEVTCDACGDDLGPYETQSDKVRALRGPYTSREVALPWRRSTAQRIAEDRNRRIPARGLVAGPEASLPATSQWPASLSIGVDGAS